MDSTPPLSTQARQHTNLFECQQPGQAICLPVRGQAGAAFTGPEYVFCWPEVVNVSPLGTLSNL